MTDLIKIAVDAMGGDDSPNKTINGIIHNQNKNVFYKIFGDEKLIKNIIGDKIKNDFYEIINTTDVVKSTDSPLEGAKRGKNTSMWLSIESVKKKEADIVASAGNTGALLVISVAEKSNLLNAPETYMNKISANVKDPNIIDLDNSIKKNIYNLFNLFLLSHLVIWTLIPFFSNKNLPLDVIEALAWGSNLDWGFEKHPPLSAFFTEIFYQVFGNQDWAYYLLIKYLLFFHLFFLLINTNDEYRLFDKRILT